MMKKFLDEDNPHFTKIFTSWGNKNNYPCYYWPKKTRLKGVCSICTLGSVCSERSSFIWDIPESIFFVFYPCDDVSIIVLWCGCNWLASSWHLNEAGPIKCSPSEIWAGLWEMSQSLGCDGLWWEWNHCNVHTPEERSPNFYCRNP